MHKNNIRFVHTYNAVASVTIVQSPEGSEAIDNVEYFELIFHVGLQFVMLIDLFVKGLMLKSLPKHENKKIKDFIFVDFLLHNDLILFE